MVLEEALGEVAIGRSGNEDGPGRATGVDGAEGMDSITGGADDLTSPRRTLEVDTSDSGDSTGLLTTW